MESVIYIRVDEEKKKALEIKAKKLGLTLTGYCRMLLLKSLCRKEGGDDESI